MRAGVECVLVCVFPLVVEEKNSQGVIKLRQQMSPHEDDHNAQCTICTHNHITYIIRSTRIYLSVELQAWLLSGQKEKQVGQAWKLNWWKTQILGQPPTNLL